MKRAFATLPALLAAACQVPADGSAFPAGTAVIGRPGAVRILHDGELFTEYRYAGLRVPALYPLIGPTGVGLTRGWPLEELDGEERDHPHHTSLWLAHGDVNGHDFWHGQDTTIRNAESIVSSCGGDSATMSARNRWMAGDELVLLESRRMLLEVRDGERVLDFDFALSPTSAPVTFGDTKEGTFALRLHPALRLRGAMAAGRARNSLGTEGAEVWGQRARWVAYDGPVEGQEVTVVLMDHPSNPRHPTWWHARDYGLVAANPFGAHDFEGAPEGSGDLTVGAAESLRLRYRVLLAEGRLEVEDIEASWREFTEPR